MKKLFRSFNMKTVLWAASFVVFLPLSVWAEETLTTGSSVSSMTIGSGETYNELIMKNGSSADDITVANGGTMTVEGGLARRTDISDDGIMNISGGRAEYTTINGGTMNVNGGTVTYTTIAGGEMNVNGVGINEVKIDGGTLNLSENGEANNIIINANGAMNITDGSTAYVIGLTVNSGGFFKASDASNVSLTGPIEVYEGGSLTGGTLNGGIATVSGTVSDMTVGSGTELTLNSGSTANSTTVNDGGKVTADAGAFLTGATDVQVGGNLTGGTLKDGGIATVSGTINDMIAGSGSVISLNDSGIANNTTISDGGQMTVNSDTATVDGLTVEGGATFEALESTVLKGDISVETGATATGGTVSQGGNASVSGAIENMTAGSNGTITVNDGGKATDITAASDGLLILNSNSEALGNTNIENGGSLEAIESGASISNLVVENGGSFVLSNKITITAADIEGNADGTIENGVVDSFYINSGSKINVDDGEIKKSAVGDGGVLVLSDGGVATNTILYSGGQMTVNSDAATVDGLTVEGGAAFEALQNTELSGAINIQADGTATGGTLNQDAEANVSGTINDMIAGSGSVINLKDSGIANNTTVSDDGKMIVNSDTATVENLTVETGASFEALQNTKLSGAINIKADGTATGGTLNQDAEANVSGTINDMIAGSGSVINLNDSGIANNTVIKDGGEININSTSATINVLTVETGGTATGGILKQGATANVSGTTNSMTVDNLGVLNLNDSATANNTIVNSGGSMIVNSNDATVNVLTVENGANFEASENTVLKGAVLVKAGGNASGGYLDQNTEASVNGTISNLTVGNLGKLNLNNGGTANNTRLKDGGSIDINNAEISDSAIEGGQLDASDTDILNTVMTGGEVNLNAGTKAQDSYVEGGIINVKDGATANNSYIGNGGIITVGGEANIVQVNDQGTINIADTGKVLNVTIGNGGEISTENGSSIYNLTVENQGIANIENGTLLGGVLSIDKDAVFGGNLDFNNLFANGGSEVNNLILTSGVNSVFGGKIINSDTVFNRSLTLKDGNFVVSNSGQSDAVEIEGWNSIALTNSITKLESDLLLQGAEKKISIDSSSTLDVSGYAGNKNSISLGGNIINAGTIDLSGSNLSAGDIFTVNGNYTADDGANIVLDVRPESSEADKIIVNGDVVGKTSVLLRTSSNKESEGKIEYAQVTGSVSEGADAFKIWRVEGSPYSWGTLFENNKWYTYVSDGSKPFMVPETVAYYGLIDNTFMQTASLGANLRNNIAINEYRKVPCKLARNQKYSSSICRSGRPAFTGWLAPVYSSAEVETPYKYAASLTGFDGGLDIIGNGVAKLGLLASYRNGVYSFDEKGENYNIDGEAETTINSYLAGAYMRVDSNYWSVLLAGYGGMLDADISTDDSVSADTSGTTFGATLDVNYIYKNINGLRIEPGVRISYTSVILNEIEDNAGKVQEFDNASRTEIEAGIRFAKRWDFPDSRAEIFVKPSVVQTINNSSEFELNKNSLLDSTEDRTLLKVEAGMSFDMTQHWSASLAGSYSFASDYTNATANMSLMYNF